MIDDKAFIDALQDSEEPLTTREVAETVGTVQSNAARRLRNLQDEGKVKEAGKAQYGNILWAPSRRRRRRTQNKTNGRNSQQGRPHIFQSEQREPIAPAAERPQRQAVKAAHSAEEDEVVLEIVNLHKSMLKMHQKLLQERGIVV